MGLFWDTKVDKVGYVVQDIVSSANRELRRAEESLNQYGGVTYQNRSTMDSIYNTLISKKEQIERATSDLSGSQLNKISVPWVDGRYFPLTLWMSFYVMVINEIVQELNKR